MSRNSYKTKTLRGLLCGNCNVMIGLADENIKILVNAIRYLKRNNKC